MDENKTQQVRESLKTWISLDNKERELKNEIKLLREQKQKYSAEILAYMKDNEVDNFTLEESGGQLSRNVRTSRPPLKRSTLRAQLFMHFAEDPQKVSEFLRSIEGIPEGAEDMSVGGTQRELLVRRLPREKKTMMM